MATAEATTTTSILTTPVEPYLDSLRARAV